MAQHPGEQKRDFPNELKEFPDVQEENPNEAQALTADDAAAAPVVAGSLGVLLLLSCWTDPKAGKQPCVEREPAGHVPPVRTRWTEIAVAESE